MLQTAFLTVAGYSLQAAVVILVVILMRLLLRKLGAPTVVSYALWAVVLFRLLCPFSIESPVGVIPEEIADVPQEQAIVDYEYVPTDVALMSGFLSLGDAVGGSIDGVDFDYESETAGPHGDGYGRVFPVEALLLTLGSLWPVGIAVLVIYSVIAYFRLRRKLVGAIPLEGNIRLADHITSPFVMGLFRPKIYLPSNLSETEREYIILHEQYHIRRLDHIVKILAFIALCIHWFNPLVWLAFYLSGKDMEMSCDEAVVKKLGEDIRANYSASLLKLSTGRTVIAATPLAFGEGDTKGRIQNLAKWKKPAVYITVVAVILCAVVIALCATNSGGGNNLKVRLSSVGVEVTCRFDDEVDDWAVYEDIYLEGELISSETVMINGEHPKSADTSKKFDFIFKTNMTAAEGGGFSGPLRYSTIDENRTIVNREVDLPREHYTGSGTTLGDGLKKANSIRRDLRENGEAILFSVILSTEPDGSVTAMHKELGVTGANDTVIQYRLVTADYVRDWPEKINGNLFCYIPDQPLWDGPTAEIYVSERCLYLTPYSSYAAMGGDSGYRYLMGDNGVHKVRSDGSGGFTLTAVPNWEKWEEFPWTEEEWKALFWTEDMWLVDVSSYAKREYCFLSEEACLLRMDGSLWLVELRHNEQMGTHVYSIYSLVPERTKGSVQWEVNLTSGSIAFPFVFDMEYDEISAVCTERPLVDLDGFEPPTEIGVYSPKSDYALVFPEGHAVYWSPINADREFAKSGIIHFTVHREETMVCAGTVYIHSWVEAETGNRTYSATLVGTGLVMEQNPDGGAVIRLR